MFRTIVFSAFGAGLVVCVVISALQFFTTEPLILHAEQFEGTADSGHHHDAATPAHDHGEAGTGRRPMASSAGPIRSSPISFSARPSR